ncbi:hypothetical protein GCM10008171_33440 [Methylopila jiangsuensis]|uniref:Transposase DDE domain-containing protein n=1 Tax=Methylopila jiangsuensis TaxID=586230 RepID=A0A9W6JI65_9HYPH|nr:transposase [Methylopila jiangsuensis]GLK78090.1 hypothetical protein GCM10008171_33440 [Methylopila jiangsuensis]
MLADGFGRPLRFIPTPGQTDDVTQAPTLIKGRRADHVLADTAYDSRAVHFLNFIHLASAKLGMR